MQIPLWILSAAGAGLSRTGLLTYQKSFSENYTATELAFLSAALALPLIVPVTLFGTPNPVQTYSTRTLLAIAASGICNLLAILAYVKALGTDDLSIISPLANLTPLFTAFTEPVIRGVSLPITVFIGGVITTVGTLVLLLDTPREFRSVLTHLKRLGPWLAIGSSFLYASGSIATKVGTSGAHPFIVMFGTYLVMVGGLGAVLVYQRNPIVTQPLQTLTPSLIPLGFFQATLSLGFFPAIMLAESAAHVTIVVQLAIVVDVLLGWFIFDEDNILLRILGGVLIISGIVLVT